MLLIQRPRPYCLTLVSETPMFHEHLSGICIQNHGARSTASCPSSHPVALLGLSRQCLQFRHSFTPHFRLDDKLFSFWLLQGDSHPLSHVKGIFRFETGVKVNEFRDLRANPRCLVESQVLSFRVRWARMTSTGALGAAVGRARGNSSLVTSSAAASPGPGQRTGTPAI